MVLVGVMSYAVAFTETLTISGFPYYEFEDRDMAYVVGSAFYGIYFIVRCCCLRPCGHTRFRFVSWRSHDPLPLSMPPDSSRIYRIVETGNGFS